MPQNGCARTEKSFCRRSDKTAALLNSPPLTFADKQIVQAAIGKWAIALRFASPRFATTTMLC